MTVGILIAVGGTGAKVAEAVVHACAAGLGPSELIVGFVEQDSGNGNTGRARQAVDNYSQARRNWREGNAHRLDDGSQLLATSISLLNPSQPIWTPHPDGSTTLNRATGNRDQLDEALFNLLFEKGSVEQDMQLGIGYQGRANVGAAAIALAARDSTHPFLKSLETALGRAAQGTTVRLVIAGSLFGGTGAAGFPTLAQLLSKQAPKGLGRDAFAMAGALMLPYFSFPPPNTSAGQSGSVASADEFLVQTRTALRYYQDLQSDGRLPFNAVYLNGWDPFFPVQVHSPGTGEQQNPAMMPELFAALGVCRFMRAVDPVPDQPEIRVCSRAESHAVSWTDLPSVNADPLGPYKQLSQLIRFSIAWDYWSSYAQQQGTQNKRRTAFNPKRDPFFSKQELSRIDWAKHPPQLEMETLGSWTQGFLSWASQLASWQNEITGFNLWSLDRYRADLDEAQYAAAFDAAIIPPGMAATPTSASHVYEVLSNVRGSMKAIGLGRMVSQIYAASAVERS